MTRIRRHTQEETPFGGGVRQQPDLESRETGLAETDQEARQRFVTQPHPKRGPRQHDNTKNTYLADSANLTQDMRAKRNGIGVDTQKKLDYLAGHREDLLREVQLGVTDCNRNQPGLPSAHF